MTDRTQETELPVGDVLKRFVEYYRKHEGPRQRFEISNGVISTLGCNGRFGECCSKSQDFEDVVASIEALLK